MGSRSHPAQTSPPPASPLGDWLAVLAALLWIPQAALLAAIVAHIADGAAPTAALPPALGALALGVFRAWLDLLSARRVFAAARHELSCLRRDALFALAARSPLDPARTPSGAAAAAIAEQAEALLPYLSRSRPARLRAAVVPPVILLAVLSQSWLAALILLIAAPLIPLFMALIGLRAKEASEAQMLENGEMNALLLDRLRGLATRRAFLAPCPRRPVRARSACRAGRSLGSHRTSPSRRLCPTPRLPLPGCCAASVRRARFHGRGG